MRTTLTASAAAALLVVTTTATAGAAGTAARSAPVSKPAAQTLVTTAAAQRATTNTDWPTYHATMNRRGHATGMPTYTGGIHIAKKIALDGAVYASPLVARSRTIVATENNSVYAFDTNNKLLWKRHLGAPSPSSQRPCGDIDPLGITGTPVYLSSNQTIYVAAELSGNPPSHRLYGLNVVTGAVKFSRSLDLSGVDRSTMQERGALAVSAGRVWVPFGGLAGDCGAYKGRLVAYKLDGTGSPISYTVPTAREGGIWTPPGPTADGKGNLYVAVGNGAAGRGDRYDFTDSVLRIDRSGHRASSFSPSTWASDNDADLDLGSQGPALVNGYVFAAGKSGTAYVTHTHPLGGIGGQVSKRTLCKSFGGTAVVGKIVYVPCTDGVRAVYIDDKGGMHLVWHTSSNITGSPVVGGGIVWALDPGAGLLHALVQKTGRSRAAAVVGAVNRFATPALSGRRILVGTLSGLTIVSY